MGIKLLKYYLRFDLISRIAYNFNNIEEDIQTDSECEKEWNTKFKNKYI